MTKMRRAKKIIICALSFFLIVCIGIVLFLNLYPPLGGKPSKEQRELFKQYDNYVDGRFFNEGSEPSELSFWDFLDLDSEAAPVANEGNTVAANELEPISPIPVSEIDWNVINSDEDSLTWFGHSSFLLSIDSKKLLIDPVLGPIASPVSFAGPKRYPYNSDIMETILDEMPPIDAVLITHDHYDHLDYTSILGLKSKVAHFFVPLGVSAHLIRWGIPSERITELNWWEETEYQGLTVALTPARHFSGRQLNTNSTLWGGWVILSNNIRLFISGDGGYGTHFNEIGTKYGPFDLALIEGAQYDREWPDMHMTPEEAIQANLDLGGKNIMLMHWGAFTLANHDWNEPIERAIIVAKKRDVNIIAPEIGETVRLDSELQIPLSLWWTLDFDNAR